MNHYYITDYHPFDFYHTIHVLLNQNNLLLLKYTTVII